MEKEINKEFFEKKGWYLTLRKNIDKNGLGKNKEVTLFKEIDTMEEEEIKEIAMRAFRMIKEWEKE